MHRSNAFSGAANSPWAAPSEPPAPVASSRQDLTASQFAPLQSQPIYDSLSESDDPVPPHRGFYYSADEGPFDDPCDPFDDIIYVESE